ncbi:LIM/homeobox protein ttx-3-like isoform X2 [Denticeps clupeoides]|nr:LIM/homeobox protein ttx-3-like isoform X2 [Denticeps clupeoides]
MCSLLSADPQLRSGHEECDVTLLPGHLYCMEGQSLFCQSHYHSNSITPPFPSPVNQMQQDLGEAESVQSPKLPQEESAVMGTTSGHTKRIRTCFRNEQLRALESYFALKHNPDGKDWSCLSHKTGLPKRVLQVWFQNARAKLRRSLSADMGLESPTGSVSSETYSKHAQELQTSTINQSELSLLVPPAGDTKQCSAKKPMGYRNAVCLGYSAQEESNLSLNVDLREPGEGNWDSLAMAKQPYYC